MRLSDRHLLLGALIISFLGLGGLLWISQTMSYVLTDGLELQSLKESTPVRLEGVLDSITATDAFTIMMVRGQCQTKAVAQTKIPLPAGTPLWVEGTVTTYKGEQELEIRRYGLLEDSP